MLSHVHRAIDVGASASRTILQEQALETMSADQLSILEDMLKQAVAAGVAALEKIKLALRDAGGES